ncbi:stage III sporulation protein AA [Paenibacillus algicola]|uniref:Stage III sporulation protein AA n=1 Tax=Paenibacillus algicola TaxID=2565926 RepID=A0A4P8XIM1_9BACL|nr:stage III sporulation protein AA [Paenibacillus algicola]QCT02457.1 stage III sporulation protein AA [Paenibacillus algicola]
MNTSWLDLFPDHIQALLRCMPQDVMKPLEEIRLREGRPLELNYEGVFQFLTPAGTFTRKPEEAYKPTREDMLRLLDMMSNHSLYTLEEELRKGFITIPGGHRVGLAGRTVLSDGKVRHIRDISSFNLRLAKEMRGAAEPLLPYLLDRDRNRIRHTLMVSSPQKGKTTILRDLARLISSGYSPSAFTACQGKKVGVVDERSEIAGCIQGVPSFDLGPRTDVLDGCPKAEGMMMMIRSMSPEVLMVDEIGRPEDAEAVSEALHAGISVVATAHGSSLEDAAGRQALASLMKARVFERYAVLDRSQGGFFFRLYDASVNEIKSSWPHGVVT